MTLWWWRICRSPTWLRRAKPVPDPDNPGQYLANGARAKPGLSRSISDASWGQFVSILRAKAEDAGRICIEVDPETPRMAARNCGHAAPKIVTQAVFRCRACGHGPTPAMNTPHATSYELDWPFTRKPREKKPAAFQPSEKSPTQRHTSKPLNTVASSRTSRRDGLACIARKARRFRLGWTQNVW